MTGLERAKLERAEAGEAPLAPQASDVFAERIDALFSADFPSTKTQKRGSAMPDKGRAMQEPDNSAHLYVGLGIKLKGEISGCDMMRIEGTFDGNASARQLILCPGGAYYGTAQIEEAEIEGTFDGTLSVHGRLHLKNKGRIAGKLSYGQLEIERGGEIDGEVVPFDKQAGVKPKEPPKTADVSVVLPKPVAPVQQTAVTPVVAAPKPAATTVQAVSQPPRPAQAPAVVTASAPRPAAPSLNGQSVVTPAQ